MTRNLLEDYPHICSKIAEFEARENRVVSDTVSGSSEDYPYTKHPIGIRGVARLTPKEETRLARLREKKYQIEVWVDALPSQREKNVVELHALQGLGWSRIFRKTGHLSPDAARVFYNRTLEKYL